MIGRLGEFEYIGVIGGIHHKDQVTLFDATMVYL